MGLADPAPNDVVREEDLDFSHFRCCGDEDLHPFRCSSCGRLMVFCYECETLFADLHDLNQRAHEVNHSEPSRPIFSCPGCGHAFEYDFMENRAYDAAKNDWLHAGLGGLLRR